MSPDVSDELTTLERILRRDRLLVTAALCLVTLLSWIYLVDMAIDMGALPSFGSDSSEVASTEGSDTKQAAANMEGSETKESEAAMEGSGTKEGIAGAMSMTQIQSWSADYFVMMFLMWAIMMVGMMVPSAAPMILVYAGMVRKRQNASPYLSTGSFVGGYLFVWTAFSLAATVLQWGMDETALLSPMMVSTSPWLGAGLLIAAGIFQLTPYKKACLRHCRTPFSFFMEHWSTGKLGAFKMGLHHGWYCLGCCWAIMGLLFFGGVMNLVWIGAITIFVLLEKVLPRVEMAGRVSGYAMIAFGAFVLAAGLG